MRLGLVIPAPYFKKGERRMPYFVSQTLTTINDTDIQAISTDNAQEPTKTYLVLSHAPLALDSYPTVTILGSVIIAGPIGAEVPYEVKRISATQTVYKGTGISFGPAPIGVGIIGSTFGVN
jgi:hypothetical protein